MGLLRRIGDLITGKATRAVEEAEGNDIDAVYRAAVTEARNELEEAEDLLRQAGGVLYGLQQKKKDQDAEMKQLDLDITEAMKQQNVQIGGILIQSKDKLTAEITQTEADLITAQAELQSVSQIVQEQETEVQNLVREQETAKNAVKTDSILTNIQNRKKNLGIHGNEGLTNVRAKVQQAKANTATMNNLHASSTQGQLEQLRKNASTSSSEDRFRQMMSGETK